jgi:hypothetical protein
MMTAYIDLYRAVLFSNLPSPADPRSSRGSIQQGLNPVALALVSLVLGAGVAEDIESIKLLEYL